MKINHLSRGRVSVRFAHSGRFLLGDSETKGFLNFCFTVHDPIHFKCSLALETLTRIFSRTTNPHAEVFTRVFVGLSAGQVAKYTVCDHIASKRIKKCHCATLEVLSKYFRENPNTNLKSLLNPIAVNIYEGWTANSSRNPICFEQHPNPSSRGFDASSFVPSDYNTIFRPADLQEINEDAHQRRTKMAQFYNQGHIKREATCNKSQPKSAIMRDVQLVNHDFLFLSLQQTELANPKSSSPARGSCFQKANHETKHRIVEFSLREGKKEFNAIFQYQLSSEPTLHRRVFSVSTRFILAAVKESDMTSVCPERKSSYNASSSTNCEELDSDSFPLENRVNCQFEGNISMKFKPCGELEQVEICLAALTQETTGFLVSPKLLEPSLFEIIGAMIQV